MRLKKIVFTQTLKGSTPYIMHTYLYSLVNEASMLMGMIIKSYILPLPNKVILVPPPILP